MYRKTITAAIISIIFLLGSNINASEDETTLNIKKPAPLTLQKKEVTEAQSTQAAQGLTFNLTIEDEKCDKSEYSVKPVVKLLMDGKPIAGESVLLEIRAIPWSARISTSDNGKTRGAVCKFEPKSQKTYRLVATSRGQTREIILDPIGVCEKANKNFSFSIKLEQENCDTGSYSVSPVATALLDGKPIAGESVLFEIRSMQFGAHLKTGEDGKTRGLTKTFEPVEGKTYKLEVTARGKTKEIILNPAEACRETNRNFTIDVKLENEKCVSGKYSTGIVATALNNGKPVEGESVAFEIRSIPWSSRTITGPDGKTRGNTITIDAIQGKTYKLAVFARGKTKEITIDTKKACGW